ncbi:glutamine--fructose-6-phosphate transaminase (isomerizing) [candidate division KSB1 bacterium]|nr:glutamine--fructose-6-phosphate transaminase (isomerizing) [candidate division KSB1 bacterium]
MCGIVGYVGHQDAVPILLDGLSKLEYRGYDSAGVAVQRGEKIEIRRSVGKLVNLQKSLAQKQIAGTCGIGHTRWATHGKPSEQNAHPHRSESCVLVHNGIIENYVELKQRLLKDGYKFQSETDTEVVAHLIDKHLQKAGLHLADAVRAAAKEIRGSYAITVISEREPGMLVAARSGCPLVIGRSTDASFVGSDVMAMLAHTRDVTFLEEGDVAEVTASNVTYTDLDGHPVTRKNSMVTWDASAAEKSGYPHFMLKEIHEQPQTILDTIRGRYSYESGEADLPDIGLTPKQFAEVGRIWIVACGTSWHAGLVGKYLLEEMVRTPVQVDIASEFRYRSPIIDQGTLVFVISQSGETADTLAALREAKRKGAKVFGICNVVGSTIARETDAGVFLHAGPEIGVASTKAFTSQLTVLSLLTLLLARMRSMSAAKGGEIVQAMQALPRNIETILGQREQVRKIAESFHHCSNFLYLGRGYNFPVALEGALKLKEISYIHAEGYPAAEMKHGPIALIDDNMPVVFIATQDSTYDKIMSNIEEVRARKGRVIAIATEGDDEIRKVSDHVIYVPRTIEMLTPLLTIIPLQLLAYYIAIMRGCDVDQPRNLAKSVTVE